MRALLGTASHYCEAVVLESRAETINHTPSTRVQTQMQEAPPGPLVRYPVLVLGAILLVLGAVLKY